MGFAPIFTNNKTKQFISRVLVGLLNFLIVLKTWSLAVFRWLKGPSLTIGRFLFRYFFVTGYRLALFLKRLTRRALGPVHGQALAVFANRYAVHATIIALAVFISATNASAREVETTDMGERTLLYSMLATDESDYSATIEDATPAIYQPAGISYLGSGVLRTTGGIDFDYEIFAQTTLATLGDGTVVALTTPRSGRSTAPRERVVEHAVEAGDTIGSIAADYQISISTILWANNLGPRDYLQIGQKLKIPPLDGVIHKVKTGDTVAKIASRYGAAAAEILTANRLSDAAELRVGDELIVPDGEPPAAPAAKIAKTPRPIASLKNIFVPPSASANRSTRLLWPTSGHVITQYYGVWENVHGVRVHSGLDIDGHYDSPLYAAEDGVVTRAGWGTGYGYMVDIDHGGGLVTRYGHSSKLFVKAGDYVKRGQTIAMMGTTGWSTGTHLHFEVRIGGRTVNPISYLR